MKRGQRIFMMSIALILPSAPAAAEVTAAPPAPIAEDHPSEEKHASDADPAAIGENHKERSAKEVVSKLFEKTEAAPGVFKYYFQRVWTKLDELRNMDEQNDMLRRRVAELEIENATLSHRYLDCRETARAKKIKTRAMREGGVETARTVASLNPSVPELLSRPPKGIFDAGLRAFNAGDYETAAKAFTQLAELSENPVFQTAQVFFLGGVSLYHLGNFKKAEGLLSEASTHATGAAHAFAPRALAWIALCRAKLGDHEGSRRAAHELIQKFPRSKEARKVNRRG